jgi:hypothetical protein
MKTFNQRLWLSVIALTIAVVVCSSSNALASGTFWDPCGGGGSYSGDSSLPTACIIGTHGTATFSYSNQAATGTAGTDYFNMHISPIFIVGSTALYPANAKAGTPAGVAGYYNETFPNWTIANASTLLELDGTVVLHTNSTVSLVLTGTLGNTDTIDWSAFDNATGTVTINESINGKAILSGYTTRQMVFQLDIPDYATQPTSPPPFPPGAPAIEILAVTISGSGARTAHYFANGSPLYEGVPEPSALLLLFVTGIAGLVTARVKKKA